MRLFDSTTATLERALDVRLSRQNVLSNNLANVDTPEFTPQDVDFQKAMASAQRDGAAGLTTTNAAHIGAAPGAREEMPLKEDEAAMRGIDGNAVNLDRTMVTLAENAMQYGGSARAVSKKLAILRYVTGDGQP